MMRIRMKIDAQQHQEQQQGTGPFGSGFTFRTYGYSVTAALLAALMMTVLGFALVSSLRHLLWVSMMKGHPMPPLWLWLGAGALAAVLLALWYRMTWAALVQGQKRRRFIQRVQPLLRPLPYKLPPELTRIADWYVIDDKHERYAFTWGIKRSKIAISEGLWEALDESAQRAVLYHEAGHVMARDPLQQTILHVLAQALQPLGLGLLYQRYLLRREILADRLAIAACEGDDVPLLTALLAATESAAADESRVGLAGALEARLSFMETGQLPSWWDQHVRYRLLSTGVAILLTVSEGILVWCH